MGLVGGLTAQGLGLLLRRRSPLVARTIWQLGVAGILGIALYERDALLFSGQLLGAYVLSIWLFRKPV